MDPTIILLEDEPIAAVTIKWLAWLLVMTIFMMALIYFSNYFACDKMQVYDTHVDGRRVNKRDSKWQKMFTQDDHDTFV